MNQASLGHARAGGSPFIGWSSRWRAAAGDEAWRRQYPGCRRRGPFSSFLFLAAVAVQRARLLRTRWWQLLAVHAPNNSAKSYTESSAAAAVAERAEASDVNREQLFSAVLPARARSIGSCALCRGMIWWRAFLNDARASVLAWCGWIGRRLAFVPRGYGI